MLRWRAAESWTIGVSDDRLELRRAGALASLSMPHDVAQEVYVQLTSSNPTTNTSRQAIAVLQSLENDSAVARESICEGHILARFEPGPRSGRRRPRPTMAAPPQLIGAAHLRFGKNGPELAGSSTGGRVLLLSAWALELASRMIAQFDPEIADSRPYTDFIELLALARLLVPSPNNDAAGAWGFHDSIFHAATRFDSSAGPFGRRLELPTDVTPRKVPTPLSTEVTRFGPPPPSIQMLSVHEALNLRRSVRNHGGAPIGSPELGAVLGGSLRVRELVDTPTGELAWRPIPTGGARSGLSALVLANVTSDLQRGIYEYDAVNHELALVERATPTMTRWLELAQRLTGIEPATLQVMILLTLDYARPAFAYDSIVYATALKEVGAALQAMALVSTDLDLAFCPMGSGFATNDGLGSNIRPAVIVGEAVFGRAGRVPDD